jgi:hypothetical protein
MESAPAREFLSGDFMQTITKSFGKKLIRANLFKNETASLIRRNKFFSYELTPAANNELYKDLTKTFFS